jgi:phthalate 4,5-cis-dihydrodiol dehydrogenase
VIGLGRAFTLMLPAFRGDQRIRLAGACDTREAAGTRFTGEFGAPHYPSVEALAEAADVDVLYIASPPQYHAAHTAAAAACGKHVLVEKPMALTLADCDEMIATCRQAGVTLMVGHSHSFDTPYLETRRLIDSGEFGSVRMIQAMNYTDFLYRLRRPDELDTEAGGGVLFSQAAHHVDIARLLAGSDVSRLRAVAGSWDPARPTEGAYSALLWFCSGAVASLTYSGYAHFDSDELCHSIGERGSRKNAASYGAARRRLAAMTRQEEGDAKAASGYGGARYREPDEGPVAGHHHFGPVIVSCDRADIRPMPDEIQVFAGDDRRTIALELPRSPRFEVMDELLDAVRGGRWPLHDGEWGRETLRVCLAMLTSAREGRDAVLR